MQSKIEKQVMASVGVIYAGRKLLSRTAFACYILALSALAIGKLVWVSRVFDNFFAVESHGFGAISNYLLVAVEHTNVAVQLTLVVAVFALGLLVADFVKSLSARQNFAL